MCWSLFLKNWQTFRPATLLKRDLSTGVFLCMVKIFNNGSFLYGPKGLRSRLYDSVRLQGPIQGLVFVFKSTSLAQKQVPICIREPKSIKFLHWLILVVFDGFRSF